MILSGGDPLTLGDAKLAGLIRDLQAIDHIQRLRIHTRIPVVLPERVTGALIDTLNTWRLTRVMVLHINHPRELGAHARAAIATLHRAGIPLLNQSVLLHGVNDDIDTLCKLSETLFAEHILPYYLHLLDPVSGAAHFAVDEAIAVALHESMREKLPGYLVPRLVRETAGRPCKDIIA